MMRMFSWALLHLTHHQLSRLVPVIPLVAEFPLTFDLPLLPPTSIDDLLYL